MTQTDLGAPQPLDALARMARALGDAQTPAAAATAVSQCLYALVGAPVVCVLFRARAGGFELVSSCHADWLVADPTVRRKLRAALSRVAVTGQAQPVSSLLDVALADDLHLAGAHTVLAAPLVLGGETRGLLGVLLPRNTAPPDNRVMAVLAGLAVGSLPAAGGGGAQRGAQPPAGGTSSPPGTRFPNVEPTVEPTVDPTVDPTADLAEASAPGRGARTVLIIDDEETVRGFLTEALRTLGFSVRAAASTTEALAALASGPRPDLVLFDLSIPGEDAASSYEALVRALPDARIILASGHVEERARELVPVAADAAYLGKPFRVRALRSLLEG